MIKIHRFNGVVKVLFGWIDLQSKTDFNVKDSMLLRSWLCFYSLAEGCLSGIEFIYRSLGAASAIGGGSPNVSPKFLSHATVLLWLNLELDDFAPMVFFILEVQIEILCLKASKFPN